MWASQVVRRSSWELRVHTESLRGEKFHGRKRAEIFILKGAEEDALSIKEKSNASLSKTVLASRAEE
jgi:hypothetical protein